MPQWLLTSLLVGMGGFAGSLARYGLSLASQRFAFSLPIGTLGANLLGCFAIGIIAEVASATKALTPELRLLLATGFCGGFTTMSSFVYETAQMAKAHEYFYAVLYLGATIVGSMLAFGIGSVLVKLVLKSTGGLWN